MSVRFRLVNMFERSVSRPLPTRVPEVEHAVRLAADEARAEHDVGLALEDRLHQPRVLARVVFEVGVLDDDHVAGRRGESRAQRGAFALILLMQDYPVDLCPPSGH